MGAGLFFCPKYFGLLVSFAILKSYENNPKWMNWEWWVIVGFALYTFISTIYGRYQEGLSIGILTDIFWIILYLAILYIYLPKFENKDQINKRVDDIPLRFGHFIMTATGIILGISVAIVVLCISQLIPFLDFITIPLVKALSFIL